MSGPASLRARLRSALRHKAGAMLQRWPFAARTPEPMPIVLHQRRILVLPTGAGLAFALALLVMLVASINYQLSLGLALCFLLAGVGTVSIVHTFRNLHRLRIETGPCAPVFCGSDACFELIVTNPQSVRRPALRLRTQHTSAGFELPPLASTRVALHHPMARRGRWPLGRTIIETSWPLGLVRAWSPCMPALDCLVYPAAEHPAPPLPGTGDAPAIRAARDDMAADGDDFAGLRAHRDSDSPRHVAWKVFARGGPLMTRHYHQAQGEELTLAWQALPGALDDEARLSRLTAWVLEAERLQRRYALHLPGCQIAASSGARHRQHCLHALALYGLPDGGRDDEACAAG